LPRPSLVHEVERGEVGPGMGVAAGATVCAALRATRAPGDAPTPPSASPRVARVRGVQAALSDRAAGRLTHVQRSLPVSTVVPEEDSMSRRTPRAPKWLKEQVQRFEVHSLVGGEMRVTPIYRGGLTEDGCAPVGFPTRMAIAGWIEARLNAAMEDDDG